MKKVFFVVFHTTFIQFSFKNFINITTSAASCAVLMPLAIPQKH